MQSAKAISPIHHPNTFALHLQGLQMLKGVGSKSNVQLLRAGGKKAAVEAKEFPKIFLYLSVTGQILS